ncbi:MAG: iron-sulfur cluster assembly protein [Microcoleaceae cyanobacterium]
MTHSSPFIKPQFEIPDAEVDAQTAHRRRMVIDCLKQVIEPILKDNIIRLGMVRNLRVIDDYVYLRFYVGDHQRDLETQVQDALSDFTWCK